MPGAAARGGTRAVDEAHYSDEPLDEVLEDSEEKRLRATAPVAAWLEHAMADRLGLDVNGMSRDDREDLKMDLLEVFLAGAIAQRIGWVVVEEPPVRGR
ncbi:MAG: hypothetical protein NTZ05_07680 [Chloroflexi bacterium]|nr:hypothetical protein [Chloroflexota bacterium]